MRVKGFSQELSNVPKSFELRRDPKDEKYIVLAVAVEASFLVSRDKDLLDLMNDAHPDSRDFRACFPHLRILDPVAFLAATSLTRSPQQSLGFPRLGAGDIDAVGADFAVEGTGVDAQLFGGGGAVALMLAECVADQPLFGRG